jgi:hypothetical protein
VAHPKVPLGNGFTLDFVREARKTRIPILLPHAPAVYVLPKILNAIREVVLPAFKPFLE